MGRDSGEASPEALGLDPCLCSHLLLIDVHEPPIPNDPVARDHDVAHVAGSDPEEPVPGKVRLVERPWRCVVEDDEIGRGAGLERAEQRLAEHAADEARALGDALERPSERRLDVVLAQPEIRRAGLLEQVRADAVRAERDVRSECAHVCMPDAVVHVRAGVVRDGRTRLLHELELVDVEVDAVCEQRAARRAPALLQARATAARDRRRSSAAWMWSGPNSAQAASVSSREGEARRAPRTGRGTTGARARESAGFPRCLDGHASAPSRSETS